MLRTHMHAYENLQFVTKCCQINMTVRKVLIDLHYQVFTFILVKHSTKSAPCYMYFKLLAKFPTATYPQAYLSTCPVQSRLLVFQFQLFTISFKHSC